MEAPLEALVTLSAFGAFLSLGPLAFVLLRGRRFRIAAAIASPFVYIALGK